MSSPILPWRIRLSLSLLKRVTGASRRSNYTVNRRLINFLEFKSQPSPTTPVNGVTSTDISVDRSRNLWFRLYNPTSTASSPSVPVIIFYHGGGFVFLSPDNKLYDAVCRRFARKIQAVVISVNYRLAPEHKYPAQYDDGFDVLKFLDEGGKKVLPDNSDLSCCFLAGDSAGGNLAHHVAVKACQSEFRKLKVMGVIAIQPFFGGEEITEAEKRLDGIDPLVSMEATEWMWKAFMPPHEGGDRDHQVINVSGPRAVDISKFNFPASLVVIGGFDSLQDWQRRYYKWLKKSGKEVYLIEYPTMIHAFYLFPELPESANIISEVKEFMFKQLSKIGKL